MFCAVLSDFQNNNKVIVLGLTRPERQRHTGKWVFQESELNIEQIEQAGTLVMVTHTHISTCSTLTPTYSHASTISPLTTLVHSFYIHHFTSLSRLLSKLNRFHLQSHYFQSLLSPLSLIPSLDLLYLFTASVVTTSHSVERIRRTSGISPL